MNLAVIPVKDRHHYTQPLVDSLGCHVIVVDNGSTRPARDVLTGCEVLDGRDRNLSECWNLGLDRAAEIARGPHNVAVLNNDLEVGPGFLDTLAAGLRSDPRNVLACPADDLPAGKCDGGRRVTGWAFMLAGEAGLRADPQFAWWYGDNDLERQARRVGHVVHVGGTHHRHLEPSVSTNSSRRLRDLAANDAVRFAAKWG